MNKPTLLTTLFPDWSFYILCCVFLVCVQVRVAADGVLDRPSGWWGIWHGNVGGNPFKYSGGLGTYPWQHNCIAVYDAESNKTFFVLGLAARDVTGRESWVTYPDSRVGPQLRGNTHQVGVGVYDHTTGRVSRPHVLSRKPDGYDHTDAHENGTLQLDGDGHVWVFINSHGPSRYHSFVYRSVNPHDISAFEEIAGTEDIMDPSDRSGAVDHADVSKGVNFSYSHPWFLPESNAILFLHSKYDAWSSRNPALKIGRIQPDDSVTWTEGRSLLQVERGHYLVSNRRGERVGFAFNLHPQSGGLDARTKLYYAELEGTDKVLRTLGGTVIPTPATSRAAIAPALVHNYAADGLLVCLKDIVFDTAGHPVILYMTSQSARTGAAGDPRVWKTARWDGGHWLRRPVGTTGHNYDHGSLWILPEDEEERWRLLAPMAPGPQPDGAGGEMEVWESIDQGQTWDVVRRLPRPGPFNANFARRVENCHPDFAAIWADGNPMQPSASSFYFSNVDGTRVWRLPRRIEGEEGHADPSDTPGLFPAIFHWEAEDWVDLVTVHPAQRIHRVVHQTDGASQNAWLLFEAEAEEDWIEFGLTEIPPGRYLLHWRTKFLHRRGMVQVLANGEPVGSPLDTYANSQTGFYKTLRSAEVEPDAGGNLVLRFVVTGKHADATGYHVSFDTLELFSVTVSEDNDSVLTVEDAAVTGTWQIRDTQPAQTFGPHFLHDGNADKGTNRVEWTWTVPIAGRHEIALYWNVGESYPWDRGPDRAHNAQVILSSPALGERPFRVDQREGDGFWFTLGTFDLPEGEEVRVRIGTEGTTRPVVADSVRFRRLPASEPGSQR